MKKSQGQDIKEESWPRGFIKLNPEQPEKPKLTPEIYQKFQLAKSLLIHKRKGKIPDLNLIFYPIELVNLVNLENICQKEFEDFKQKVELGQFSKRQQKKLLRNLEA